MKFVRRDPAEPSINLAPLIDIVFLLLIFIMVSTRFVHADKLTLALPVAANARAGESTSEIRVTVAADGGYRIDGRRVGAAGIASVLRARRQRYPDRALRVRADANARHAAVVRVLDAAASIGFARVDIAARSDYDRPRPAAP